MPRVKSIKPYDWNQKPMPAGIEHDATEQEAQLLEALGWACRLSSAPTYQTRVMTAARAAPTPSHMPRPNRQQRRQQTARRDMNADAQADKP